MKRQVSIKKIQEVADKIAREFNPEKIILFGSWAWSNPTSDSDVDLFIVKETNNTRTLARQIDGAIFPRPFPLDILVCHPEKFKERERQGDFFIQDIIQKGTVLYAK